MNVFHIIKGWAKYAGILSTSRAEHKLSLLRMELCRKCDHSKKSKILQIINDHGSYETVLACQKCACPCKQKTLVVDESCPVGKW